MDFDGIGFLLQGLHQIRDGYLPLVGEKGFSKGLAVAKSLGNPREGILQAVKAPLAISST
jgi:hypothetical protein